MTYIAIENSIGITFDNDGNIIAYGKEVPNPSLVVQLNQAEMKRLNDGAPISLIGNKVVVGKVKTQEEIAAELKAQEDKRAAEEAENLARKKAEEKAKAEEENEVKRLADLANLDTLSNKDIVALVKLLAKHNLKVRNAQ